MTGSAADQLDEHFDKFPDPEHNRVSTVAEEKVRQAANDSSKVIDGGLSCRIGWRVTPPYPFCPF